MKNLSANQQAMVWMTIGALLMAIVLVWTMPLIRRMTGVQSFTQLDAPPMNEHLKSLNNYVCSRDCCSTQYPPSFDAPRDPRVDPSIHSTSNYMCSVFEANKGQHAGCMCATKDISEYHTTRGGNRMVV